MVLSLLMDIPCALLRDLLLLFDVKVSVTMEDILSL